MPYKDAYNDLVVKDSSYRDCLTKSKWDEALTMKEFLLIFNTGEYLFFNLFSF